VNVHTSPKEALAGILGSDALIAEEQYLHQWAIDGLCPEAIVRPGSVEDIARVMRWACQEGEGVVFRGGGTFIQAGYPPDRDFIVLSLDRLSRMVDYQPADMTVTVEAGMTLSALQSVLRAQGQFLPVDPPCPQRATIGGLLAANASGPSRYGYGTLRDMLIGIRVVLADGSVVKGGGRVVKNVAGYDTPKLYIGSWGTLGAIVEATFKIRPLPSATATALWPFERPDPAEPLIAGLIDSDLLPTFLELTSSELLQEVLPPSLRTAPCILSAGFDGNRESVAWQREHAGGIAQGKGILAPIVLQGQEEVSYRKALSEAINTAWGGLSCKANLLSSQVASFCEVAQKAAREAGLQAAIAAHAGSGIVYLHVRECLDERGAISWLQRSGDQIQAAGGNLVVLKAPRPVKEAVPVWGRPTGDRDLMRRLRSKLDPKGILNPGRYI